MSENNGRKYLCAELNAKPLRRVVDALRMWSNETKLRISPEGIKSKQVDQAHVGLIDVEMKKGLFESFKASVFELGIDLDKLDGILKLAKSGDLVKLEMDDKKENALYVSFGGVLRRRIGCLDTAGMPDPKIPKINTDVQAKLKTCHMQLGLNASSQLSDYIRIKSDKDVLKIFTEGDTDKVDIKLRNGENGELLEYNGDGKTESMYTIDFIKSCIKPASGDVSLSLEFSTDKPIKINYSMDDGNILFKYLVAPRIENN